MVFLFDGERQRHKIMPKNISCEGMEGPSVDDDLAITVLTCEGDLRDPAFPKRLRQIVCKLKRLISDAEKRFEVTKVEPWNSVRVTFNIPREAAQRLKQLAEKGDRTLRELGILSVQIEGDQIITLTLSNNFKDSHQDLLLGRASETVSNALAVPLTSIAASSTTEIPLPCNSYVNNNNNILSTGTVSRDVVTPTSGSNVEVTKKNIAQYLSQQNSVVSGTSAVSSATLDNDVTFRSPNVVAPVSSEPLPFINSNSNLTSAALLPKPSCSTVNVLSGVTTTTLSSRLPNQLAANSVASNVNLFPFASMQHAMNTKQALNASQNSVQQSNQVSSNPNVRLPLHINSSHSQTSTSLPYVASTAPSVPNTSQPFLSKQHVLNNARTTAPVQAQTLTLSIATSNSAKAYTSGNGASANVALTSPLLVNLLQNDASNGNSLGKGNVMPPPTPNVQAVASGSSVQQKQRKQRKSRKSKDKPEATESHTPPPASSSIFTVSASQPSLVSQTVLHPLPSKLQTQTVNALSIQSQQSQQSYSLPPHLISIPSGAITKYPSIHPEAQGQPQVVRANHIPIRMHMGHLQESTSAVGAPQVATTGTLISGKNSIFNTTTANVKVSTPPPVSCETSSSPATSLLTLTTSTNESPQTDKLTTSDAFSPPPSSRESGKTKHLINPFTGHLEPMLSDEDEEERSPVTASPFRELETISETGGQSERSLSDTGSNGKEYNQSSDTDSGLGKSGTDVSSQSSNEVNNGDTMTKQEESSTANNKEVGNKCSDEKPSEKTPEMIPTDSNQTQAKVLTNNATSISVSEPRVPPLHISLRGANAVVVSGRRESTGEIEMKSATKKSRSRTTRAVSVESTLSDHNSKNQKTTLRREQRFLSGGCIITSSRSEITKEPVSENIVEAPTEPVSETMTKSPVRTPEKETLDENNENENNDEKEMEVQYENDISVEQYVPAPNTPSPKSAIDIPTISENENPPSVGPTADSAICTTANLSTPESTSLSLPSGSDDSNSATEQLQSSEGNEDLKSELPKPPSNETEPCETSSIDVETIKNHIESEEEVTENHIETPEPADLSKVKEDIVENLEVDSLKTTVDTDLQSEVQVSSIVTAAPAIVSDIEVNSEKPILTSIDNELQSPEKFEAPVSNLFNHLSSSLENLTAKDECEEPNILKFEIKTEIIKDEDECSSQPQMNGNLTDESSGESSLDAPQEMLTSIVEESEECNDPKISDTLSNGEIVEPSLVQEESLNSDENIPECSVMFGISEKEEDEAEAEPETEEVVLNKYDEAIHELSEDNNTNNSSELSESKSIEYESDRANEQSEEIIEFNDENKSENEAEQDIKDEISENSKEELESEENSSESKHNIAVKDETSETEPVSESNKQPLQIIITSTVPSLTTTTTTAFSQQFKPAPLEPGNRVTLITFKPNLSPNSTMPISSANSSTSDIMNSVIPPKAVPIKLLTIPSGGAGISVRSAASKLVELINSSSGTAPVSPLSPNTVKTASSTSSPLNTSSPPVRLIVSKVATTGNVAQSGVPVSVGNQLGQLVVTGNSLAQLVVKSVVVTNPSPTVKIVPDSRSPTINASSLLMSVPSVSNSNNTTMLETKMTNAVVTSDQSSTETNLHNDVKDESIEFANDESPLSPSNINSSPFMDVSSFEPVNLTIPCFDPPNSEESQPSRVIEEDPTNIVENYVIMENDATEEDDDIDLDKLHSVASGDHNYIMKKVTDGDEMALNLSRNNDDLKNDNFAKLKEGASRVYLSQNSQSDAHARPHKRKCSENAAELIKACMGVEDQPKKGFNPISYASLVANYPAVGMQIKHHTHNLSARNRTGIEQTVTCGESILETSFPNRAKNSRMRRSKTNENPSLLGSPDCSSEDELTVHDLSTKSWPNKSRLRPGKIEHPLIASTASLPKQRKPRDNSKEGSKRPERTRKPRDQAKSQRATRRSKDQQQQILLETDMVTINELETGSDAIHTEIVGLEINDVSSPLLNNNYDSSSTTSTTSLTSPTSLLAKRKKRGNAVASDKESPSSNKRRRIVKDR